MTLLFDFFRIYLSLYKVYIPNLLSSDNSTVKKSLTRYLSYVSVSFRTVQIHTRTCTHTFNCSTKTFHIPLRFSSLLCSFKLLLLQLFVVRV